MYSPRPEPRGSAAALIARRFPSYRDFVDDALFHPSWGYYSTGQVRFGFGGHYDTFPLALSPFFGRMVAAGAFRLWQRSGQPRRFEICELGAGNGQLCLDVLLCIDQMADQGAEASRFRGGFRYRIVERSRELIRRQRLTLGPLARRVTWTRADLTTQPAPDAPFGSHGMIVANEVLDCLSHHKIVQRVDGTPGVVFVVPRAGDRTIPRAGLAAWMKNDLERPEIRFEEVVLPLNSVPGLQAFLKRHYPEFFDVTDGFPPYFACPTIGTLVSRAARLYRHSESLWIDYGEDRDFHRRSAERFRVFAGPPRSGASIYDHPGLDDITFLVDFSVVSTEARRAGLEVVSYGPQSDLAHLSGIELDRRAHREILEHRMLGWLLAISGGGAEQNWRRRSLTWSAADGKGGSLRADVRRAVDEFTGKRRSYFKLLRLRRT